MAYHDSVFPENISQGSRGGPGYRTRIIEVDSGAEERIARLSGGGRCAFDVAYGVKNRSDIATLLTFYRARQGAANSFPFIDKNDFSTGPNHVGSPGFNDVTLSPVEGSDDQFQAVKIYSDGGFSSTRLIRKPKVSTVRVGINGGEAVSGWAIDPATGLITFTSSQAGNTVSFGGEFYVPCRFSEDVDEAMLIQFDSTYSEDNLSISGGIGLLEDIEAADQPDEASPGGGSVFSFSSDVQLSLGIGKCVTLNPSGSADVFLPPISELPFGGEYWFLRHIGSGTLTFKDLPAKATQFTMTSGQVVSIAVFPISATAGQWVAF